MTVFAGTPVLPEEKLWIWRVGFPPVRALAAFLAPWRLEGAENIPRSGGYILVANHINWKDPPWIEFALGHAIRYMGKRELFETPVIGFLLRGIGAFPVRRGEADRAALRMALNVIAAGQPLGFFAEGHRSESGQLIRGHPGVAYVAQRSGAPIVPLAVSGTPRARLGAFWRRDILLRVGEQFRASDLDVDPHDAQAVTDAIMRRIAALLPPEMRGVYRSGGGAVGLAKRLELRFEGLREDPPVRDKYELLLRIEAEFIAEADGVVILEQPHFSIVELASQLSMWLESGAATDFNYESMDAEEIILWFRKSGGTWDVGSDWHPDVVQRGFERADLIEAASTYVRAVPIRVRQDLHRDVSKLIKP